jgi:carbonic anhydrase
MKYMNKILVAGFLIFVSCSSPQSELPQKDTVAKKIPDTVTLSGDNFVRAEAPDAETKMEQGYCLSKHDNGMAQSPINIITQDAKDSNQRNVSFAFQTEIVTAENLGHTIQLDFKDGSTSLVDGKQYSAKQFHFHTPSEHLVDGITYPMEMHIVNVSRDSNEKTKPSFLVLAILFKMGKENKLIKTFLHDVPLEEGKEPVPKGTVHLEDLTAQLTGNHTNAFFTYEGSLTTPPYTERVHWVLLKRVMEASPEQIMEIEKMEGNNARHVQALYDRKVYSE